MRNIYKYSFILGLVLLIPSILFLSFKLENKPSTSKNPDEYIASYIEGEYQTAIPGKDDGYVVDKIVCDNGATGTWNNEEWGIDIRNATQKVKCSIYFVKATIADQIAALAAKDTTNFATDDPDNNIRYIGAEPNNYVYFNCSDYSNQNDSTCEKWRIIGVFGDSVKIIRNDSIGAYSFDVSDNGSGSVMWEESKLMKLLNDGYEAESIGGSLYYNSTSGKCYSYDENSRKNVEIECDFSSIGLKNDETRDAIQRKRWELGEFDDGIKFGEAQKVKSPELVYSYEMGKNNTSSNWWYGEIGLMYLSDYGYATAGGSTTERISCLKTDLSSWKNLTDCYKNNYLYNSNDSQYTLTHATISGMLGLHENGGLSLPVPYYPQEIRPSLFLDPDISILQGDGSSSNPYQLKLYEYN